jgi:Peptidase family M23
MDGRRGAIPGAVVAATVALALALVMPPGRSNAQVTPSPSPSPSPSTSPSASPSPSSSPTWPVTLDPMPAIGPSPPHSLFRDDKTTAPSQAPGSHARPPLRHAEGRRHRPRRSWIGWAPDPRWGDHGTRFLDRAARKARHRGWSRERIARTIYAPFIVIGPATWSDSWGAPRWTGGYHPHHGQDVLCRYGAPVLAATSGTVRFGRDPLGGRTVSVVKGDGSFWYYAHLRSYADDLVFGARVRVGTIIGSCGASGDATVPHVHIASFTPGNRAVDPMASLVEWLGRAQRRVRTLFDRPPEPSAPEHARPVFHPRPSHPGVDGLDGYAVVATETADSPRGRTIGVVVAVASAGSVGWAVRGRRRRRATASS